MHDQLAEQLMSMQLKHYTSCDSVLSENISVKKLLFLFVFKTSVSYMKRNRIALLASRCGRILCQFNYDSFKPMFQRQHK